MMSSWRNSSRIRYIKQAQKNLISNKKNLLICRLYLSIKTMKKCLKFLTDKNTYRNTIRLNMIQIKLKNNKLILKTLLNIIVVLKFRQVLLSFFRVLNILKKLTNQFLKLIKASQLLFILKITWLEIKGSHVYSAQ